ncbi:MAG: 16S rRNA (cytidine(1402)-2'-O)-methyltransferase [Nitrospirae bacterium]|nr:16S rRNA (cytidine(1402)-2'-O)-methyltransferase [Nitrospirota bacterium]
MKGILYIVSTPIGNLEDITLRALKILKEVDVIAAEDTRHSLKLLNHYGISKPLISYWGEKEKIKSEEILEKLQTGQSVALVSDAGTPGISDPGAVLIRKAIERGFPVVSIPGASAIIAALSIAGLPTEEFTFLGFLPTKRNQRKNLLQEISLERRTIVFYESPHRLLETLYNMKEILSERKLALIKEISKIHEEVLRGSVSEILEKLKNTKIAGEYVIVLEGKIEGERHPSDALLEVNALIKKGLGRKEAVKKVANAYGLSKKELYDKSLESK